MAQIWLSIIVSLALGLTIMYNPIGVYADSSQVYFSEIAWAGSIVSTADEWFELGNSSGSDIDLSGWRITRLSDGEEKDMLVIPSGRISANGHFLIANYAPPDTVLPLTANLVSTAVSLANTKLQLKLYDSNGLLVDTADDGVGDPAAGDNQTKASMERVLPLADGALSASWQTAITPIDPNDLTKGYGTPQIANYPKPTYESAFIVINEIMPDPSQSEEWIELYNQGDNEVNLAGWQLDDILAGGSRPYIFSNQVIQAGEFLILEKSQTGIGLNNDGDEVNLINPAGTVVDYTKYDSATEDQVWVRLNERSFGWSGYQTKTQDNRLPERVNYNNLVKISEVMPSPVGSDEVGEWVELVSLSDQPIDLSDWSLDDEEGGSSSYKFPSGLVLQPHQYLVVNRAQSKIAYNNDFDEVRLFAPDQTIVDEIKYSNTKENQSYAKFDNTWEWTSQLTPGSSNQQDVGRAMSVDVSIIIPTASNAVVKADTIIKEVAGAAVLSTVDTPAFSQIKEIVPKLEILPRPGNQKVLGLQDKSNNIRQILFIIYISGIIIFWKIYLWQREHLSITKNNRKIWQKKINPG